MGEARIDSGFNVRLEARLKNAALVGAREMAGLSAKKAAEGIDVSYNYYLGFESMRVYPSKKLQKRICGFYRGLGVFLLEEDVFPVELKKFETRRKIVAERTIPKSRLISTEVVDRRLLPMVSDVGRIVEQDELRSELDRDLSRLPYRLGQVVRMYHGINCDKKNFTEIGGVLGVTHARVGQIYKRAIKEMEEKSRRLKVYLES